VVRRWRCLFAGHPLVRRFLNGEVLSKAESQLLKTLIGEWRARLMDISWYMVALAGPCASRHSYIPEHRAV